LQRTYDSDRIALIEHQAFEKKQLQVKRKHRRAVHKRAFDMIVKKASMKNSTKADLEAESPARKDIKRAAKGTKRRSASRTTDSCHCQNLPRHAFWSVGKRDAIPF
jgi:hypothetical protein